MNPLFRSLLAAALLVPAAAACTDPPASAEGVDCPVAMRTALEVRAGDTPLTIEFAGEPPALTRIDRDREVTVVVQADVASRVRASFATAPTQPDPNAVAGTLTTSLDGGLPVAEIRFVVPLVVAGVRTCGTASTRVLPVTPPTAVPCAESALIRDRLQRIVDGATLSLQTPDPRLFTRVPLLPVVPSLELPEVGRPSGDPLTVPLGDRTTQARFQVTWGVEGAAGYATSRDGRTPVALGTPADPDVVLRALPPVVAVPSGDGPVSGAVTPRITARVHARTTTCDVSVESRTPAAASAPPVALPLPRVLALYRAADFGVGYPAWRDTPQRNSGVVLFGGDADLRAPSPQLAGLLGGATGPAGHSALGGLGARLAEIQGPVPTPHGTAGLHELPAAESLPALAGPLGALHRLTRTITKLTETYVALATRTGGRYARIETGQSVDNLDAVNLIDNEAWPSPAVHVQDEAEAAILLGPSGSAADLYTLSGFTTRIGGVFHVDSGVVRLTTAGDGYVAVVPDLAVAGPACNDTHNGWFPTPAERYAAAHPRAADDAYGSLTVKVHVDADRSRGEAPNVRRTSVDLTNEQYDALNRQREHSISRAMSSLRIGDTSLPIDGNAC